jgi:hypothetical protein
MKGQSYLDELAGVVALPCLMDCSLVDFARRIRVHIESELSKVSPDNSLIALLADAARLGWEQIEWADAPLDIKERLLNVPTTPAGVPETQAEWDKKNTLF